MNVLLLTAHSIAEFDDLRMLSDMGLDVFSIGAYTDPQHPGDDVRPPLDLPVREDLVAACVRQREAHAGEDDSYVVDWAKAHLADEVIAWADVIIAHHYLDRWIIPQWDRIKHKTVVWRTCGQSDPWLESRMKPLRSEGLRIVRYSPKERPHFESVGEFAGEDAVIRFGKYREDFLEWTGSEEVIGNVTQDLPGRGDHVGLSFWLMATQGLPVLPGGEGSENLKGVGRMDPDRMLEYLARIRVYLYTGTRPASYTLGLIEALMTGTPVVSIGPQAWGRVNGSPVFPPELFEGHELSGLHSDDPNVARNFLRAALASQEWAAQVAHDQRDKARLFDVEPIMEQWAEFLGGKIVRKVAV